MGQGKEEGSGLEYCPDMSNISSSIEFIGGKKGGADYGVVVRPSQQKVAP